MTEKLDITNSSVFFKMKNFTLTFLTFLLIQWCNPHNISCTTVPEIQNNSNEVHQLLPSSADNLIKTSGKDEINNLTNHNFYNSASPLQINEKKLQWKQKVLYRQAGGHLKGNVSTLFTTEKSSKRLNYPTEPPVSQELDSNNIKSHNSYFRRNINSSTSQQNKNSSLNTRYVRERDGSNNKTINVIILDNSNSKEINDTNDEGNNLDYGLMAISATGDGKIRNKTLYDNEELAKTSLKDLKKNEKSKTLSDQIAEGKYGLIEKEIFNKKPKAPGIISYKTNSETPNDNDKTLGGLNKDEIWLSEDHLLVLKGGITNDKKENEKETDWSPIDDFEAPKRPVKIPLNPKVPPPFPVQLTENGPLQFIGQNQFSIFNPYANETGLFANVNGHITSIGEANIYNSKNTPSGSGAIKNPSKDKVHEVIPPPPWLFHNSYKDADLLKHFPFNLPLPDQALNRTEEFDEDDPSLFYPPPYSFVYNINYTNLASVGPLVPGIILPPPPNFFSVYDPEENKKPIKTPLDAYHRIKDIQLKNRLSATTHSSSTTTEQPPKSSISPLMREVTQKTKAATVSTISSIKSYKTKLTTARPVSVQSTTIPQFKTHKDLMNYKTHHYDTTTLRLHPIYISPTVTTKLYSSTTTTISPLIDAEMPRIKQFQKDYGTQHHPIYFEYFDARTANPINENQFVSSEYEMSYTSGHSSTSTNISPPFQQQQQVVVPNSQSPKVNKKQKSFYPPQFISTTISPANIDAKYIFVTPKPDIVETVIAPQKYPIATENPISYDAAISVQKPLILKPVSKFEDEIAAIKQTLDYYNMNDGRHKHTQKPKVKALYEFSFEASKHKTQHQQEEFQPMLSYNQKIAQSELIKTNSNFPTSTEPIINYYRTKQSAVLPPKIIQNTHIESNIPTAPPSMVYGQKLRQQNINYYNRPIFKEVVTSPHQSQQSQKIIAYPSQSSHDIQSSSVDQHGYRINSKNIKYRNPHHNQQQQQFYGPSSEITSLINDTLVNYRHPQRPINPLSEFIDVSRFPQNSPISPPHIPPQNSPPYILPHLYPQHLPAYPTHPPQIPYLQKQQPIFPGLFQKPIAQQQSQQSYRQSSSHHSSSDVVKFDYPLISQINPDSVHITFYNRPLEKSSKGKF